MSALRSTRFLSKYPNFGTASPFFSFSFSFVITPSFGLSLLNNIVSYHVFAICTVLSFSFMYV